MTQMRPRFYKFISIHPEIEKCYYEGLINRRSLVRYMIKEGLAEKDDFDALLGIIRRYEFDNKLYHKKEKFKRTRLSVKDGIMIIDFDRHKTNISDIIHCMETIDYAIGDTFKFVLGTASMKIFIDAKNVFRFEKLIKENPHAIIKRDMSEIGLIFDDDVIEGKGIISTLSREFVINDVRIEELLSNRPELLIYMNDDYVVKAIETIKSLKV